VGCDQEDCEERLIAAAAVGGPIGLLVAQAASCAANSRQNQLQFILIGGSDRLDRIDLDRLSGLKCAAIQTGVGSQSVKDRLSGLSGLKLYVALLSTMQLD